MPDPHHILRTVFGYPEFRPGQADIVAALLAGKDVLAILPTGAGKSLCFQVPGICRDGTAIVISPLISLMQDQVQTLQKKGIAAEYLSSAQSDTEKTKATQLLASQQLKFIYVAPERLQSKQFQQAVAKIKISLLVIDEAHCVSTWGHQFRPEYRMIAKFRSTLAPEIPTAAFTATATPHVARDITASLKLRQPQKFQRSFARANLSVHIYPCESHTARELALLRLIRKHRRQAGIVYATTRSATEELVVLIAKFLPEIRIAAYHGGMQTDERTQIQADFLAGKLQLITATTAFGMGVDKPDVRYVIHYQLSASIENYYQEIGRAGRDGSLSSCYLLCVPHDAHIQLELIKKNGTREQQRSAISKLKAMAQLTTCQTCYHQAVLRYFGEESEHCTNRCSNCLREARDHELLYGLSDTKERQTLMRLLDTRSQDAVQRAVPERAVATDKQICWQALISSSS